MTWKQKIYCHYKQILFGKISRLQNILDDLKESGANETKSTAGDKHETALAMLQIEQANTRSQMDEVLLQKDAYEKIDPLVSSDIIGKGSVVQTNRGYFFISAALGKTILDEKIFVAISSQSPLAQKLSGHKTGDSVELNGNRFIIESVL